MNQMHQRICSSEKWALKTRERLLPWALHGVELGTDVLEIGPGYGANLRVLVEQVPHLTAVEVDAETARLLDVAWGERARIVHADGADMPLPDASYDSVVCFTMLHHVPSAELQDRIFAEAFRVLRPGGTFMRQRQPVEPPLPAGPLPRHHERRRPRDPARAPHRRGLHGRRRDRARAGRQPPLPRPAAVAPPPLGRSGPEPPYVPPLPRVSTACRS